MIELSNPSKMHFKKFVEYLEKIESISSRNEITMILSEIFSNLELSEIRNATYLLLGRLAPKYNPLEFNISAKLILRSLTDERFGQNIDSQKIYAQEGDIGTTIEIIRTKIDAKSKYLNINEVHNLLTQIATASGSGSQQEKITQLTELILNLTPVEGKYIGRMIVGKIRLGLSDKTILDALSYFKAGDKSMRDSIERAFGVRSDIGEIASIVKESEKENLQKTLSHLKVIPGTPIASKLVEREKNLEAAFERMQICLIQPKLDGLRTQIHFDRKRNCAEIFSRNMERITDMFPDIAKSVAQLPVDSIVIDSETIGFDIQTGKYLAFQETIQRKRKHGVDDKVNEIPVKTLAFDILYLNGEDITQLPVEERIEKLKTLLNDKNNQIQMLETVRIESNEELSEYFEAQVTKGLEGVIVKKLGTAYEAGTRNFDWIKLKASMKSDMVDSVDAVVMGYYNGRGTRNKFGVGALLIGIYDQEDGKYKTIAKVGTGITDELFTQIKSDLDKIELGEKPENFEIEKILMPDVFVEAKIVVVVEADEITRSKTHTAAKDAEGRGLSMRFPRLKVWNRPDKDAQSTTTAKELTQMFELGK